MAPGWGRMSHQVPEGLRRAATEEFARRPHGWAKLIGSLGTAIVLGLPDDVRTLLCMWAQNQTFEDPDRLTPAATMEALSQILKVCAEQAKRDQAQSSPESAEKGEEPDRFLAMVINDQVDLSMLLKMRGSPTPTEEESKTRRKKVM